MNYFHFLYLHVGISARVEEIEEELDRVRGDCDALRNEREMMITAHQNQIEQLRESFKVRLADVDRWPQKVFAHPTITTKQGSHLAVRFSCCSIRYSVQTTG